MDIYFRKRRWNLGFIVIVIITFLLMVWYSNSLMDKMAKDERNKITIWANAVQRKAEIVAFTNNFFKEVAAEEEIHASHIAKAIMKLSSPELKSEEDLSFYLDFIADNKTVPCILVDENNEITSTRNLDSSYLERIDTPEKLQKTIADEKYIKIPINYHADKYVYLYYKESIIYTQLREVFRDIIHNFFSEVINNVPSLPVIVTDSSQQVVLLHSNIDSSRIKDSVYVKNLVETMRIKNEPIQVMLDEHTYAYVLYEESFILRVLRVFPIIQMFLTAIFIFIAYLLFRFARRLEQDQIWVGMSKETAHQLGTPLSSLMAWVEILENENVNPDIVREINKDISRLENIAQRFSKIGSIPKLEVENVNLITCEFIAYFQNRISSGIKFQIKIPECQINACINKHLFEWVLENLCKNAVDAMDGVGTITVEIQEDKQFIYIDISDTGKGIDPKRQKTIFEPGVTTKSRGWGLGLTLARRIINDYHNGKIEIKYSAVNKGSTFRIKLKKFSNVTKYEKKNHSNFLVDCKQYLHCFFSRH
ncbi:MAG: HAMP domain-containing histidine kinase [Bacteroidales bacterium]|jgi:signal transduction histidine kinase|nr:HAMP domain-containing histidine kinase [Bacteroidales bacterium]